MISKNEIYHVQMPTEAQLDFGFLCTNREVHLSLQTNLKRSHNQDRQEVVILATTS